MLYNIFVPKRKGEIIMRKLAAIIVIILSLSSPINAEYDPQHTMLALNMAIVSVNRILTAQSRAVLEQ